MRRPGGGWLAASARATMNRGSVTRCTGGDMITSESGGNRGQSRKDTRPGRGHEKSAPGQPAIRHAKPAASNAHPDRNGGHALATEHGHMKTACYWPWRMKKRSAIGRQLAPDGADSAHCSACAAGTRTGANPRTRRLKSVRGVAAERAQGICGWRPTGILSKKSCLASRSGIERPRRRFRLLRSKARWVALAGTRR